MSCEDVNANHLAPLISDLSAAAEGVEADDLSVLAKMHGWCEAIIAAASPGSETPCPPVREHAGSVGRLLEALILGEADNAEAALASVVEAVSDLSKIIAESYSDDGALVCPAPDVPTDEAPPPAPTDGGPTAKEEVPGEQVPTEQQTVDMTDAESEAVAAVEAELAAELGVTDAPESQTDVQEESPYESEPLKINKKEEEFVKAFVEEAYEHIESIEAALLEVEREPDNAAHIDELFRPFHTIKGMAGFLNLRDINCLTHEAETIMDHCRKGKRSITSGLIDIIFDVVDILKVQIGAVAAHLADPPGDTVEQPPVAEMIHKLRAINAGRLEPEGRDSAAGSGSKKVGAILVEQGAVVPEAVDGALELQDSGETTKKTGEILVGNGQTTPREVGRALRTQAQKSAPEPQSAAGAPAAGPVGEQSVRIDTAKLDALVDMVGELVIAQTQVSANAQIANDPKLNKDTEQVTKIIRDVQEVAMAMRMVTIGPTFQKMARLVRDVSRKAGKQVELKISGEDTELDKNVIQQIGDPLVHMVRNAVDHGIEPPDVRLASGKPEVGHVHLNAYHQGGNIAIEITDDGKGLDSAALIAKGIEKGIVQPGTELSDSEAYSLVFAPGFSTAAKVTDISGRGVGMDVVRRNIEQLRGRVEISSEKGRGSTFSIRLPLTLAIIDGMVVGVGTERFIIQTITIEQSLRPVGSQITTVQHKGEVLNVRGRLIPLIQLGELFGLTARIDPCEAMVVIAHCEGRQIGLVVDRLIGQQQVVIKTLGERFEKLQGISGGAILGDGCVGLILEMSGLFTAYNARRNPSRRITRSGSKTDKTGADSADTDEEKGPVSAGDAPPSALPEEAEAVHEPALA